MIDVLLLVAGLALLSYAADRFVLGAARLSTALRVSPVIIGAVVIGFGTSAPELLVSVLATLRGAQDIAFGNVVGSNIANVTLVLGAAAMFRPLTVGVKTLRRELPVMLAAMLVLAALVWNLRVHTWEGALLLAVAVVAIGLIVRTALRDREARDAMAAEVAEYEGPAVSLGRSALITVAGLLGTLAGAQMLVQGAIGLSRAMGISEAVIGLTIVAVGTSLPELVTAVAAARRGETDLVVGNVLGSNLFNALLVAGVSGVLDTVVLDGAFRLSAAIMVGSSLLAGAMLLSGRRIGRAEGGVLLAAFVLSTAFLL